MQQEVCMIDTMRVQQVLINLISNAIKFSHSDSMIFITVQTSRCSSKEFSVSIAVKDTGIGINAEDQKKLFQPFFQTTD